MTMTRIVLAARPTGEVGPEHFRTETSPLPHPAEGQFLARVIWLSLDPYMRGRMNDTKSYAPPTALGEPITAGCVAEVMESRHPGFAKGDLVVAPLGWVSHGLSDGVGVRKLDPAVAPLSTALGVLGMPGFTAWIGLNAIAGAKARETIVISAATGAVGSLAGQLARAKGMRVIGLAGGAEKCAYAVQSLGYDVCLDHRPGDVTSLSAQIAEAAPRGVDVYFENVGGKSLEAVLPNLNTFGRIALCGMIAWYSGAKEPTIAVPALWSAILRQRLRVEGFIVFDRAARWPEFEAEVAPMLRAGQITWRETVAEGLDSAPAAFMSLLKGGNFGKQLVRVGPDPA